MADLTSSETPLPPPTTTSTRALQPRQTSKSASSSRSRTTSRAGSRAASVRPADQAPNSDHPASARDSLSPLPDPPVKRELSTDDAGGEPQPGPSSLLPRSEQYGAPSAKRRRLDTDSVEDLLAAADDSLMSSIILPEPERGPATVAQPSNTETPDANTSDSHITNVSTNVGESTGPGNGAETIDADSIREQGEADTEVPVHTFASSSASGQTGAPAGSPRDPVEPAPEPAVAVPLDSEQVKTTKAEPLASFNCPICFSPPRFPTMTPCGHICCGECLFTAVKSTIERSQFHGPPSDNAKCPVCRALIPGWDGMGGGVIGLKPTFSRRNKRGGNKNNDAGAARNTDNHVELGSSQRQA